MSVQHIAIIYGGRSTEHEISIRSARNIAKAIDRTKYSVSLIAISKDGTWYSKSMDELNTEDIVLASGNRLSLIPGGKRGVLVNMNTLSEVPPLDAVFPIVHGTGGEDGSLQGLLKTMNIPFVGPGIVGSALCIDKEIAKRLLTESGIANSKFLAYHSSQRNQITYEHAVEVLGVPMYIKPPNLGSSIGISKVTTKRQFDAAIDNALQYDRKVLIEQSIEGREIECAVMGNTDVQASPVGEVLTNEEDYTFYDYTAKYTDANGSVSVIPAELEVGTQNRIREIAVRTYKVLNCEGMARVDVFVTKNKDIIVNEVNTLPGFTDISMFPKLWEAGGIAYADLITKLIEMAIERSKDEDKMHTSV